MKKYCPYITIGMILSLALFLCPTDVYAADVFQTVRDKAAEFIKSLRSLIFIIAGFGLIGFAFAAIFGKINWKWFANIAIGLFLVANVGLFIDYMATKDGGAGQYASALGYGNYLDASGGYTETPGSSNNPQSQGDPGAGDGTGNKGNNNSSDLNNGCVPGTGVNCNNNGSSGQQGSSSTGNQSQTGGNGQTGDNAQNGAENNGSNNGTNNNGTNNNGGNTQNNNNQLPPEIQNAPEMNLDDIINAMGQNSNSNTSGNPAAENASSAEDLFNQISNSDIINEETPDEAPLPGTGFEQQAAACAAKGGTWSGNQCYVPEEETPDEAPLPGTGFENVYDVDGGMLDEVVIGGTDYSKERQSCQLKGGTWNSDTLSCDINFQ